MSFFCTHCGVKWTGFPMAGWVVLWNKIRNLRVFLGSWKGTWSLFLKSALSSGKKCSYGHSTMENLWQTTVLVSEPRLHEYGVE